MNNEENPNESQVPISQPDAATTPIDLASAFKALNQVNREAAEADVDDGEDPAGSESVDVSGSGETVAGMEANAAGYSGEQANNGGNGGSADGIEAIDFNSYKQEMLRDIQRNAKIQVQNEFKEQDIGYYSISELQIRDEKSGRVMYRNPDVRDERDPDYYFKSRTEAQDFCEAWNKGVDFEYRKAVNEKQNELLQMAVPTARLIDFLPKWQSMDPATQQVFDALLEGHEIRDANGKEIGFNVDLNAVAAQAQKIVKNFQPAQTQNNNQKPPANNQASNSSGPALDMQTGNGKSGDEVEPKNIGEALKMLDKKNKGGK